MALISAISGLRPTKDKNLASERPLQINELQRAFENHSFEARNPYSPYMARSQRFYRINYGAESDVLSGLLGKYTVSIPGVAGGLGIRGVG